jgi:hypothetical protein
VNEDAVQSLFAELLKSAPPPRGRQSAMQLVIQRHQNMIRRLIARKWTAGQLARALKNAGAKESVGTLQRYISAVTADASRKSTPIDDMKQHDQRPIIHTETGHLSAEDQETTTAERDAVIS